MTDFREKRRSEKWVELDWVKRRIKQKLRQSLFDIAEKRGGRAKKECHFHFFPIYLRDDGDIFILLHL